MAAPRRQRPTPQRIITPESLEVGREVIEPDEVQAQPEHWKRIAEEVSRQLDFQPARFFWREIVRPKYVRADDRARSAGAFAGEQICRPSAVLPAAKDVLAAAGRVHPVR